MSKLGPELDEMWLPVSGWERYLVSSNGRVRSLPGGKGRYKNGGEVAPIKTKKGYLVVNFTEGKRRKQFLVHRLVIATFVGGGQKGDQCCHSNGVRDDNWLGNLRWGTAQENHDDAIQHGTHSSLQEWNQCLKKQ